MLSSAEAPFTPLVRLKLAIWFTPWSYSTRGTPEVGPSLLILVLIFNCPNWVRFNAYQSALLSVGLHTPMEPLMELPSATGLFWFQLLLGSVSVCAQVQSGTAKASAYVKSLRFGLMVGVRVGCFGEFLSPVGPWVSVWPGKCDRASIPLIERRGSKSPGIRNRKPSHIRGVPCWIDPAQPPMPRTMAIQRMGFDMRVDRACCLYRDQMLLVVR